MKYELALVIKPLSSEEIKEKTLPKIEAALNDLGATFKLFNPLGKRLLAYPMDKFKEGVYYFYNLELSSAKAVELRAFLRSNQDVLRSLLILKKD